MFRFTVEQSGHVRDAEAVSATDTDLEVAACAKRVLSEWVFARHASGEVTVERAYRLGDGRAAMPATGWRGPHIDRGRMAQANYAAPAHAVGQRLPESGARAECFGGHRRQRDLQPA